MFYFLIITFYLIINYMKQVQKVFLGHYTCSQCLLIINFQFTLGLETTLQKVDEFSDCLSWMRTYTFLRRCFFCDIFCFSLILRDPTLSGSRVPFNKIFRAYKHFSEGEPW